MGVRLNLQGLASVLPARPPTDERTKQYKYTATQ